MTLIGIQSRFREVGRIRTGEVVEKGGKSYPARLDNFRLTSSDRDALEAAAVRYGGTVEPWKEAFELYTESDRLDVMLPPRGAAEPYSLWYELWSGGGIQRRCDGTTMVAGGDEDNDSLCQCDPEARLCAPTMRVPFLLPDLPGLGTWRLETKSYNAAAEMPGALNLLATWAQQGRPTRGVLRLEKRETKHEGKKRQFTVPVLDPVGTLNAMFLNAPERPALGPVSEALLIGTDRPLLPHELDDAGAGLDVAPAGEMGSGESPTSPAIEPSDAAVREEAEGTLALTPSDEAGAEVAPPSSAPAHSDYRRADLVQIMQEKGIDLVGLEEYATLVGIPKNTRATDAQMDQLILAVAGHGTAQPLDLGDLSGDSRPSVPQDTAGAAAEPPHPGTDEYKALPPLEKSQARAFWSTQPGYVNPDGSGKGNWAARE
jgi:hypothetical protein